MTDETIDPNATTSTEQPAPALGLADNTPIADTPVEAATYTTPAPAGPYHLIDTEHHVINLIASHLDKLKDEAIAEIQKISTAFSCTEVAKYKADVLVWLEAQ